MDMSNGKVLALDWGDVRCGWAISDPSQTLAGQSGVYERVTLATDLDFIDTLARTEGVSEVVVGIPYNMDGSIGPQAELTLNFKSTLQEALNVPVYDIDERLTSAEAERVMLEGGLSRKRRKEKRDALAAVLILQTYLDRKRKRS